MTAPKDSPASPQLLKATYTSPANPSFTHTTSLPTPPTTAPADKTAYLSALRKATAALQDTINAELTTRMEADKEVLEKSEAGTGRGTKRTIDEAKEEDNYGEEVVEED